MENQPNLRFAFVEMLFALAIGQVGIEIGDLILKNYDWVGHSYIYSHLLLSSIIISTSWVGWQSSKSIGNTKLIHSVFSLQYIILLIDIIFSYLLFYYS